MRTRRRGFTLVELLVGIAIIGILIALLLPAVQAAREAAKRSQCSNNLKQLGLALHNYHDTFKTLPSGIATSTLWASSNNKGGIGVWGWGSLILPFIEQSALHEQLQVGDLPLDDALAVNLAAFQTPISSFRCPSDKAAPLNYDHKVDGTPTATSNYIGNNRSHSIASNDHDVRGGLFFVNKAIRFRDILDGTSNTVAVGERRWQYKEQGAFNILVCGAANIYGCNDSAGDKDKADVLGSGQPRMNYNLGNKKHSETGYSSMHPGGAQFCLADGSVRFISETIDADMKDNQTARNRAVNSTWEMILARQDEGVIGAF